MQVVAVWGADNLPPGFSEDLRAFGRIQVGITQLFSVSEVEQEVSVPLESGSEVGTYPWKSRLEQANHVGVGVQSATYVLIAETVYGFDSGEFWLRGRVEELEMGLIADNACLAEE